MLFNRDLSLLASTSAIAISYYLNGRATQKGYDLLEKLSEEIDRLSKSKLSVSEELVLAEIIWPNHEDWVGKNREDVYLQANLLAKNLRYFDDSPIREQEKLRNVCLEISVISRNEMYHSKSPRRLVIV